MSSVRPRRAVGPGDDLQAVLRGTEKIDAAPAVKGVELTGQGHLRVGPVRQAAGQYPPVKSAKPRAVRQKGEMLGLDAALHLGELQVSALTEMNGSQLASFGRPSR